MSVRTNIEELDTKLDGGIPDGSLVFFEAKPGSESDNIIYSFLSTTLTTTYITTYRLSNAVEKALPDEPETTIVEAVDTPHAQISSIVTDITDKSVIIIDRIDAVNNSELVPLLRELQNWCINTDSIIYLYSSTTAGYDKSPMKAISDVTMELSTESNGDEIDNKLLITKVRNGPTIEDILKLKIGDNVRIDTSRDIA